MNLNPITFFLERYFALDLSQNIKVETNPHIRNITLFQGSKRYPELKALIPVIPLDSIVCPYYDGREIPAIAQQATLTILFVIEFYITSDGKIPFNEWYESLKDKRGRHNQTKILFLN